MCYERRRRASAASLHMKRKRHTAEEIIKKLREASTLLAGGQSVEAVCKKLEVSPPTYHRWRQEYGGAKEETVKRLKALEKENTQLKKLVADLSLGAALIAPAQSPQKLTPTIHPNSHSKRIKLRGQANKRQRPQSSLMIESCIRNQSGCKYSQLPSV